MTTNPRSGGRRRNQVHCLPDDQAVMEQAACCRGSDAGPTNAVIAQSADAVAGEGVS